MTDYIELAREYVVKNARRSNARVKPQKPYMVRWPRTSSTSIFASDTDELVKNLAEVMRIRVENGTVGNYWF